MGNSFDKIIDCLLEFFGFVIVSLGVLVLIIFAVWHLLNSVIEIWAEFL